ncbi:MAG: hypothetical protein QF369_02630 [Dehalococcoidales bacterium]|jgi:hypothetical protein|nr:hypothetical protein [Dehalococcoidales bacterium]MDP6126805.1 hypothetical protein [Dehalococcoidales bacterium]MDP6501381.1 hypothetical protein [Dehalococcoidales bacterium]
MSSYIGGLVFVIIGAVTGMGLAFVATGSVGSGAVIGGVAGLYFAIAAAVPAVSHVANHPDLNE